MIDKIKYMIELYDLTTNSRKRDLVYKRYYIYFELKKCNLSLEFIGKMVNRDHSSVIHGIKQHKYYHKCDKLYDDAIAEIKQYLYPLEIPKELPKYSIFEDITNCHNTTDLKIIKDRMNNNQYIERDK
jgi:hypothetical protein